jgi:hypothetical protein
MSKKFVDEVKQSITTNFPKSVKAQPHAPEFYIFISYDLVNSTLYKEICKNKWPDVFNSFYNFVENGIKSKHKMADARVWKYVGDELILYKKILSLEDLHTSVPNAFCVLQDTITALHREYEDAKKSGLSVKATAWCAESEPLLTREEDSKIRNISITPRPDNPNLIDFLGPDIDTGFRISKFALRRRLVVSAELSYLLYLERSHIAEDIEDKLKIVTYEVLKGITSNRRYPIIWYEHDWQNVTSTFLYDEHYNSQILNNIRDFGVKNLIMLDMLKKYLMILMMRKE